VLVVFFAIVLALSLAFTYVRREPPSHSAVAR
jgi:hypothetical protein